MCNWSQTTLSDSLVVFPLHCCTKVCVTFEGYGPVVCKEGWDMMIHAEPQLKRQIWWLLAMMKRMAYEIGLVLEVKTSMGVWSYTTWFALWLPQKAKHGCLKEKGWLVTRDRGETQDYCSKNWSNPRFMAELKEHVLACHKTINKSLKISDCLSFLSQILRKVKIIFTLWHCDSQSWIVQSN